MKCAFVRYNQLVGSLHIVREHNFGLKWFFYGDVDGFKVPFVSLIMTDMESKLASPDTLFCRSVMCKVGIHREVPLDHCHKRLLGTHEPNHACAHSSSPLQ